MMNTEEAVWTKDEEFCAWARAMLFGASGGNSTAAWDKVKESSGDSWWWNVYGHRIHHRKCEELYPMWIRRKSPPPAKESPETKINPWETALKNGEAVCALIPLRWQRREQVWQDNTGDVWDCLIEDIVVGWIPAPEEPKEFYILFETTHRSRGFIPVSLTHEKKPTTCDERNSLEQSMRDVSRSAHLRECTKKEADEWSENGILPK